MAVLSGTPTGRGDSPESARPVATSPDDQADPLAGRSVDDVPQRADGIELIGEMAGSGYREPPALARRADGQTIQLSPLLYLVLGAADGHRTYSEIADYVSDSFGRRVSEGNVRSLVDNQLRPAGLLTGADGAQPEVTKSNPLLGLRFKFAVSDPERTRRLTSPFTRLFNPILVIAVLAAFAGVCWWVFMEKGLASATYQAFDRPELLLLVFGITVLSAGFHEFGHAAAARRGGATPGVMGAGLYLVWPAFYTDVTDSYRLGRGGRVRTDLGGLYFNAIVAVAIVGVWWFTRYDALLLVVATQILQMIRQLTPLVRFDGYHLLADITGVPDLFHRIKPTLLGLLPWRWRHPETTVLKPWARAIVTLWVLAVVPLLAFSLLMMVLMLPRLVGTAWAGLGKQAAMLDQAWADFDLLEVAGRGLGMVAIAFPIFAITYILFRLVRQIGKSVWKRTHGRPVRRGIAGLVAVAIIAGLVWAWWPRPGAYRPVQPFEGGTLVQAATTISSLAPTRSTPAGLVEGQYGQITTAWADGDPMPTAEEPQLALILVPREGTGASAGTSTSTSGDPTGADGGAQSWVFPFNKPLEPGEGDNQAMAVNTTDNTVVYDLAFALVWIEDDSPALNKNEAYAFASCTDCAAVAIGFQVVLVTGENHTAVPQNIAAAVNYDCVNCLTYALAVQLFVTLDGALSDAGMAELGALWGQIADFASNITEVPLGDIREQLTTFEQQILQIIEKDQGSLPGQTTASPTAGTTDAATPGATDGTTTPGATDGATDGTTDGSTDGSGSTTSTEPDPGGSPTSSGTDTGGATSGSSSPDGGGGASQSPTPDATPTTETSPTESPLTTP